MLNVVMLSVVILNVVKLSVVMLNVVAPLVLQLCRYSVIVNVESFRPLRLLDQLAVNFQRARLQKNDTKQASLFPGMGAAVNHNQGILKVEVSLYH